MRTETAAVNVREKDENGKNVTKQIGQATFPVYESISEALEEHSEEAILTFINDQVRTIEMSRIRNLHRNGESKQALTLRALNVLITSGEIGNYAGDQAGLAKRLDEMVAEFRAEDDN